MIMLTRLLWWNVQQWARSAIVAVILVLEV